MQAYEQVRQQYKPKHIHILFIAESPPPAPAVQSSRQFYYTDRVRKDDRLFTNTIRALYPEAGEAPEATLQANKQQWLQRFMADGYYMIEALTNSQEHEVTKQQRQDRITAALPDLLDRVAALQLSKQAAIILIKSNVYDVAATPLQQAGYRVLNDGLLDYPGRFNQRAYRQKLTHYIASYKET